MLHSFCSEWSIVGYGTGASWDLGSWSIAASIVFTLGPTCTERLQDRQTDRQTDRHSDRQLVVSLKTAFSQGGLQVDIHFPFLQYLPTWRTASKWPLSVSSCRKGSDWALSLPMSPNTAKRGLQLFPAGLAVKKKRALQPEGLPTL